MYHQSSAARHRRHGGPESYSATTVDFSETPPPSVPGPPIVDVDENKYHPAHGRGLVSSFLPRSDVLANGFNQYFAAPASKIWTGAQVLADQVNSQLPQGDPQSSAYGYPQPTPATDDEEDPSDPFQSIDMPFRDRTNEFKTICKSYEMKFLNNGRVHNRDDRNKIVAGSIEFNQRAKRIGRFLSSTCVKMEKLTELAKKKSLFDDNTIEIERLQKNVQEDITGLNNQIAELSHLLAQSKGGQGSSHNKLVVVGLQSKLASVGQNFKNVLDLRTQNMKAKKSNREKYCQAEPVPSSMPKSRSNVLFQDDATASAAVRHNDSFVVDLDQMQLQEQSPLLDNTDTYYHSRLNAVENIESSITQLGQIFSQLAHLVQEQGEMITRIDSNVEHTAVNVQAGYEELVRYFANISRSRWLMIKIFGILAVFIVFFIVFLA
uniref:t-SNARE coiled-coil homology domain-containing protein n=1 Tax=Panagrellus redivivus TaxID=6233 RepID=A0A7E5A1R6_PANRE